ncbi:MAG: hypothetical protein Q9195_001219 [Heterodermia aff. obscurata]
MGFKGFFKSLCVRKDRTKPSPKPKESITSFHGIFRQAFLKSKAKKNCPTKATEQSAPDQVQPTLVQTSSSIDNSGCIKYSDTFVVADVPPSIPLSSDTSTAKCDSEAGSNASPLLFSNHTAATTISSPSGSAIDDDISERKAFPPGVAPYIIPGSNSKGLDQGSNSATSPTLRRARSQVDLGKNAQQHLIEEPAVASRRSSISYLCLNEETNRFPEVTDPLRSGLDQGLIKLHKRTASIELAQWQRTHDVKYSLPKVEYPEPVERHGVSPRSLSSDSEGGSSANGDCHGGNTGQAYEAEAEQGLKETIAFKDEQMHNLLSMYQGLVSKHEDLEAKTKQQAIAQSRAVPLTPASRAELTQLRLALETERQETLRTSQYINQLQAELASTKNSHREQDILLFNAYARINGLTEQLTIANASGGHDKIADLEQKLLAAEDTVEQQEQQLFNAFQAQQALEGDKQQLKDSVKKLTNLHHQATNQLVDMKSECERNLVQNMLMRESMEADPSKSAAYDKTVEHLQGELAAGDERAVQAEEANIQLQKDMDATAAKSKAETTALSEENRLLNLALDDQRSSNASIQNALNGLLRTLHSTSATGSSNLAATIQTDLAQHDLRLSNLLALHTLP